MLLRTLTVAALLVTFSTGAAAQNASSVIAAASKAMGVDTVTSITITGTARNGAFGQSKAIGDPLGPVNATRITEYTRTINFGSPASPTDLVSRATGPTQPPTVPGAPAPTPGVFNQNITGQQMGTFAQAFNVWSTPWAFLKAAAANNATVRQQGRNQIVSFSPANMKSPSGQAYVVTGTINNDNLVTKVETRVEHAVIGDLPIEFEYSNYQNMNGVQVPTRIVQKQAGLTTFDATITSATPNPADLVARLTPPPAPARGGGAGAPAGGAPAAGAGRGGAAAAGAPGAAPGGQGGRGAGAPAAGAPPQGARAGGPPAPAGRPEVEKLGDGAFAIGGNYLSLAVDMGDHILVVESGQSDQRGMDVMAAAKQAIPGKPVRYVVNSHPHFDHASGLAAAVAEGATILTHENNEDVLERLLRYPRTLTTDSLSKATNRRANVEGVDDRDVRRGSNGKLVELIHVPNEHSDGMLVVYLPAEKIVWSADVTGINPNPAQLPVTKAVHDTLTRLKVDYNRFMTAHPPNPDPGRALTRDDVAKAVSATN
jgi:glyoxylase-like metal-dependent hydrolase (beta-lactamase superfamily II)